MKNQIGFLLNRIGEKLWVKPLILCLLAIGGAFIAKGADYTELGKIVPDVTQDSVKTLLTVMSASMLVIATFSVSSMVSAYASASGSATPRSFSLVISDDVSQNALSAFIGAFIFSIVSLIVVENSYYDKAGRFTLFVLTLLVFAIVIITFVGWVDSIARLGRLGNTIDKVETAAAQALEKRKLAPTLGGIAATGSRSESARAVYAESVGYVQIIDINALQKFAEESNTRIEVAALPGTFASPGRALAYVSAEAGGGADDFDAEKVVQAFKIDHDRTYDEDPRFGLIVLAEIASRALSPGINDPGTAIDVIGTLVRLFTEWSAPVEESEKQPIKYDRVSVPELCINDMFDDAFGPIARDGAGTIEVVVRLEKAFESLASTGDPKMREASLDQARLVLARAEKALDFPPDVEKARKAASFAATG